MLFTAIALSALPVRVDVDTLAPTTPFEHRWKRSFGSGHAALTLRPDYRAHLKMAREQLGLQGVRYHGLFDDDMGPVVRLDGGRPVYNFTALFSTWDYMLSIGVRPIVELSFMPAWLANCSWDGGGIDWHGPPVGPPGAPKCRAHTFAYAGISAPPAGDDYAPWYALVRATVSAAVGRYGLPEIQRWSFEVWNELWGMPFPDQYMQLYNASSAAVKSVHPSIKVGGPATAGLGHVKDFADAATEQGLQFDFVSTHHYPSDPSCPRNEDWDPDCFSRDVLASRASVAAHPFYLTEYNVGCCLGYSQHDTPAAAAFVFRQVGALVDHLDVMSYWTFTDMYRPTSPPAKHPRPCGSHAQRPTALRRAASPRKSSRTSTAR